MKIVETNFEVTFDGKGMINGICFEGHSIKTFGVEYHENGQIKKVNVVGVRVEEDNSCNCPTGCKCGSEKNKEVTMADSIESFLGKLVSDLENKIENIGSEEINDDSLTNSMPVIEKYCLNTPARTASLNDDDLNEIFRTLFK